METITISDLKELHRELTKLEMNQIGPDKFYFRGESKNGWPLIPKLLRCSTLVGKDGMPGFTKKGEMSIEQIQVCLLERLKRHAVHLYLQNNRPWQGEHPSDWEWLCVAQHHGLPTLLLDWSINPLVAFYFSAWKGFAKDDGVFYVMKLRGKQFRNDNALTIRIGQNIDVADDRKRSLTNDDAHKPLVVVPLVFTQRIEAQSSRLIYTGNAAKAECMLPDKDEFEILLNGGDECQQEPFANLALDKITSDDTAWSSITKYIIPKSAKKNILRQLANVQINHGSLFPDLDGHSAYLAAGGD